MKLFCYGQGSEGIMNDVILTDYNLAHTRLGIKILITQVQGVPPTNIEDVPNNAKVFQDCLNTIQFSGLFISCSLQYFLKLYSVKNAEKCLKALIIMSNGQTAT